MIDREKLIKSIKACAHHPEHDCDSCEYCNDKLWCFNDELIKDFETLMKELEPVKPRSVSKHGANPQIQHFCGNCNAILFHHKQKYCIECGRKVKWDD